MHMLHRLAFTAALASLACAAAHAQDASPGGKPLHAELSGANEVPLAGDPNGTGYVVIRVNPGQGTVCYDITIQNIDPLGAAHIHLGAAGVPGGVLVPLPVAGGTLSGCAEGVDRDLAKAIMKDPEAYYVNVHNGAFPAGAARGQLEQGF